MKVPRKAGPEVLIARLFNGSDHPGLSIADLTDLLSSIEASFSAEPSCRHCGAQKIQRWGRPGGLGRYRCRTCGKTFNALTGTALARLRQREVLAQFITARSEGLSVRESAERCGIAVSTSHRWGQRFNGARGNAVRDPSESKRRVDHDG